jgi:hypothetical protein
VTVIDAVSVTSSLCTTAVAVAAFRSLDPVGSRRNGSDRCGVGEETSCSWFVAGPVFAPANPGRIYASSPSRGFESHHPDHRNQTLLTVERGFREPVVLPQVAMPGRGPCFGDTEQCSFGSRTSIPRRGARRLRG